MKTSFDVDFSLWLSEQISFLKERRFEELDIEHLLEEMEDLGDSFKEAIESHLTIILIHMLKQRIQPQLCCKSWQSSINDGRFQIKKKKGRHPSLKSYPDKVFAICYEDARRYASKETGLELRKFPQDCPWTLEEVLGD